MCELALLIIKFVVLFLKKKTFFKMYLFLDCIRAGHFLNTYFRSHITIKTNKGLQTEKNAAMHGTILT